MTVKLPLDANDLVNLLDAHNQLDSYESVTPGVANGPKVVQVRYKLGATRRVLVKNLNALKAALATFHETRKSLFKEIFPDVPEGAIVQKDDVADVWPRWESELNKLTAVKEEVELLLFPAGAIYNDHNEFPAAAIALLDEKGLIEETA